MSEDNFYGKLCSKFIIFSLYSSNVLISILNVFHCFLSLNLYLSFSEMKMFLSFDITNFVVRHFMFFIFFLSFANLKL